MQTYDIAEVAPGTFAVGRWEKHWFRAPSWHTTCGNFESISQAKEWIERYHADLHVPRIKFPRPVCFGFVANDGVFHQLREPFDDR